MMSSSIDPEVVTRMSTRDSSHSWAKRPLSPEVTMFDVKVRNVFAFSRFAFRRTFCASLSSIAW